MKLFLSLVFLVPFFSPAQNVGIGTDIPTGKLQIKGTADISQLVVEANIVQSNNQPLLLFTKGGSSILSINSDKPTNVFVGYLAGNADGTNLSFKNTFVGGRAGMLTNNGYANTAVGYASLNNNTSGYFLTAIGNDALKGNTTGQQNIAIGSGALSTNTGKSNSIAIGHLAMSNADNTSANTFTGNIAIGSYALYGSPVPAINTGVNNTAIGDFTMYDNENGSYNTSLGEHTLARNRGGHYNTAIGVQALYNNKTGLYNSASGINALYNNIANSYNTGIGYNALFNTTASDYNTAVGSQAGDGYNNGFNNVFVGANVDVNGGGYYNVVAIGQGTVVGGVSTARFGNTATSSYGGWAGWTNLSDGRFKTNVLENVPGLPFISKLRPVTYNLDAIGLEIFLHKNDSKDKKTAAAENVLLQKALHEKELITYTGFIAQEVEESAKALGFTFSGVDKARNENDTYGLRYAEFVVPLVKAVQELDAENKHLKNALQKLNENFEVLKKAVEDLQKKLK